MSPKARPTCPRCGSDDPGSRRNGCAETPDLAFHEPAHVPPPDPEPEVEAAGSEVDLEVHVDKRPEEAKARDDLPEPVEPSPEELALEEARQAEEARYWQEREKDEGARAEARDDAEDDLRGGEQ